MTANCAVRMTATSMKGDSRMLVPASLGSTTCHAEQGMITERVSAAAIRLTSVPMLSADVQTISKIKLKLLP
jgi:hypothetical protein